MDYKENFIADFELRIVQDQSIFEINTKKHIEKKRTLEKQTNKQINNNP